LIRIDEASRHFKKLLLDCPRIIYAFQTAIGSPEINGEFVEILKFTFNFHSQPINNAFLRCYYMDIYYSGGVDSINRRQKSLFAVGGVSNFATKTFDRAKPICYHLVAPLQNLPNKNMSDNLLWWTLDLYRQESTQRFLVSSIRKYFE
jgi:hypothetical protein